MPEPNTPAAKTTELSLIYGSNVDCTTILKQKFIFTSYTASPFQYPRIRSMQFLVRQLELKQCIFQTERRVALAKNCIVHAFISSI